MNEPLNFKLTPAAYNFIMGVLRTAPLPYDQVSQVIADLDRQLQAQIAERSPAEPAPAVEGENE